MRHINCDLNTQFGHWIIINNIPIVKNGHNYVTARCTCGKEQLICLSDLRSGRATGCRNCKARERSLDIKIGDNFKQWLVIDGPVIGKGSVVLWKVRCMECNTSERYIQGNELVNNSKCFKCLKCAMKTKGNTQALNKGKIGELSLTRYSKLGRSALKRNIQFNVSLEYLWNLFKLQDYKCAITGDVLLSINKASLDRIDSDRGYEEGNVQWTTTQSNLSKHKMTMQELYNFCTKVLNNANQQPIRPLTKLEGSETNG